MAGTSIWKGAIRFGALEVPVKLHAAVKEERLQFHLLHKRDLRRLHQQLICTYEKIPVPVAAQTKGFEVEEGKYLLIDPAELDELSPESSRQIEVHEFVGAGQLAPQFLDHVYYLEPDSELPGYRELAAALAALAVAGICSWTMRKHSYLGALQASGPLLRLTTLRYADELIAVASLGLAEISVNEKELEIGCQLINQLTAPFRPEKFVDEHQQKLRALIEQKARGEKITVLRPRLLEPTAPDQLLQALEASLQKVA
ncbi:non-homologous end joining protein Ku [Geotalea uraniireducens]|uniref:Non-homologous end joining protein Ku n=1 Tax=Geotalea uraniireducens TaxID=351604 RepID=A0ABM8EKG7_9BACT|nr:Ku protein [Geotalea uraniireducens]BDV42947.1 non-homologous end joining protein Ku [Geotalea uraniireducens]